ncbi:hypothetical protein B0T19DRAFT_1680 [Cercophora scortea]|uniref:Uncharacterized protein n=1 Tax=Cercophora scortea TaxID=314031 RepID=A0AAE0J1F4_9PEZI|nr:hypothetical protein B0T19DRAFT_1680 [Cercophora scortea]
MAGAWIALRRSRFPFSALPSSLGRGEGTRRYCRLSKVPKSYISSLFACLLSSLKQKPSSLDPLPPTHHQVSIRPSTPYNNSTVINMLFVKALAAALATSAVAFKLPAGISLDHGNTDRAVQGIKDQCNNAANAEGVQGCAMRSDNALYTIWGDVVVFMCYGGEAMEREISIAFEKITYSCLWVVYCGVVAA